MAGLVAVGLSAAACGEDVPPPKPVLDVVDVLVNDDYLRAKGCATIAQLELRGRMRVAGLPASCGLTVKADGEVVSICGDVPGKSQRIFTVEYLAKDAQGDLLLVTTQARLDLTSVTDSPVTMDLTRLTDRDEPDEDNDGQSNFDELCAGTNPRG